jgi:CRISPR/Cas system-associated endoribonuclease Cas2
VIAYDIRSRQRLQKLHRFLRTQAYSIQESVFAWSGTDDELVIFKQKVLKLIRPNEDDFRGYRLPPNSVIELSGSNPFGKGVFDNGYPPHKVIMELADLPAEQARLSNAP